MTLGPPVHLKYIRPGALFMMGDDLCEKTDSPWDSLYPGQDFVTLKNGFHASLVGHDSPACREVIEEEIAAACEPA